MDRLSRLLKEGKLGKWCKLGAWVVVVLSVLHIAIVLYAAWQVNLSQQQQQGQIGPQYYILDILILPNIAALLQDTATSVFYFLALYVAGVVFSTFATPPVSDVIYQSLDDIEEDISVDEETAHT